MAKRGSGNISLREPLLDCWLLQPKTGEPVRGRSIEEKRNVEYEIESLLGVGGKGMVFKARRKPRSKPAGSGSFPDSTEFLVLKFPRFDFSHLDERDSPRDRLHALKKYLAERTEEFNREYERSKRLLESFPVAHKTIDLLTIEYVFEVEDKEEPILLRIGVQQYLEGEQWFSLDDLRLPWVREVKVSSIEKPAPRTIDYEREWLPLAQAIGKAVETVHLRRVVHGDIWAPNVFVARGDWQSNPDPLRLIDFGNSWSTEFVSAQLGGGRRDNYAPPEERRALLPKSQASDAFGYGVLLLWLLTGPDNTLSAGVGDKVDLLMAYLRRKQADKLVWNIARSSRINFHDEDKQSLATDVVQGLLSEQIEALEKVDPTLGPQIAEQLDTTLREQIEKDQPVPAPLAKADPALDQKMAEQLDKTLRERILEDERVLENHLRRTLEKEYADDRSQAAGRTRDAETEIKRWRTSRWLKGRMYRPCETMIYDPGEVIIENAASQRKCVREKILNSDVGREIYRKNPWIVDVISHCVADDQARRPRMMDTLRDLHTYSNNPPDCDPLRAVQAHQRKVFGLNEIVQSAPEQIDLKESRDLLIEFMSVGLRTLRRGDIYSTVTTCDMWHAKALGHDGRYLSANWEALKNGAAIRRIFLISMEELGTSYVMRLLLRLARKLCVHNEQVTVSRKLEEMLINLADANNHTLRSVAMVDPPTELGRRKTLAFRNLVYHVRYAMQRQIKENINPSNPDQWHDSECVRRTYEQRYEARRRLRLVLEGYHVFLKNLGARLASDHDPNVTKDSVFVFDDHQDTPREDQNYEHLIDAEEFARCSPGLFLGLRVEPTIAHAVRLRGSCPRAIIRTREAMTVKGKETRHVLIETDARGRSRDNVTTLPELTGLRIYYGEIEESPTVKAFQRIRYGLDNLTDERVEEQKAPCRS